MLERRSRKDSGRLSCPGEEPVVRPEDPGIGKLSGSVRDAVVVAEAPLRRGRGCGPHIDEPMDLDRIIAFVRATESFWVTILKLLRMLYGQGLLDDGARGTQSPAGGGRPR